ncbi:hypothetical protein A265_00255 [Zymomonas mobilis subsp. mobilis str. CP4 = NRRL B-14023]|nr:hypothetical protein ZCP4_0255 [Zymomonas mobilis subsp. mobilis str. CP4 = NRRL B-14023]AHJ69890.1 hypothetical protein A254_00255 [Zymomonas mobilis subsp. mobilis NRRL B-12526]TQK78418.1 hypothetical protein FBY53_1094 [Zymomonas mobilis]AHJ71745.1 hypothetical protein A265_00255 [Zymomonas mobilis subsp. mobilis str. CP4 = NRRL B-14023]TQL16377.1 hypothetical protein FBY51_1434 [Zymomonas mobilis]
MPSLFGFAPGGVYLAIAVTGNAVRSYRTFSSLLYYRSKKRFVFCGTFPEVTLAGCYPAPLLLGARTFLPYVKNIPAAARPSGRKGDTKNHPNVEDYS